MAAATFTAQEREAMLETLVTKHNQDHVTRLLGESGPKLDKFLDDCLGLTNTYPGGIEAYLTTARRLLEDAKEGANPYLHFEPRVPEGDRLEFGTQAWTDMEEAGLANAAGACFVLVAGGLGERLGYNGIKVALPHETATGKCYLQCYIETILALQAEARRRNPEQAATLKLPLFIMTSGDTHALTTKLLADNSNFGLDEDQLDVVMQELVPALQDSDARIVVDPETGAVAKKPHGHGDVHITLSQSGVAARWLAEGRRTVIFFQDTNGMVMHAIPAFLGATVQGGFAMNSLTVPRRPGEAVGAICNLQHKDDPANKSLTINVEYNQLGPLLVAVNGEGDVADESGFSPFPGNINVLSFDLERYAKVLASSGGVVPEFVNPKYSDETKTSFVKPTRLECMMQDFPKLLAGSDAKVGFTQVERWTSFSAVKNNNRDAAKKFAATGVAESAATGEASAHYWFRHVLASAGVQVSENGEPEAAVEYYPGIPTPSAARVVLAPSVGLTRAAILSKFPTPSAVKISDRSVLLVEGSGVTIKSLDLDGTLVIRAVEGAKVVVDGLVVKNDGWSYQQLTEADLEDSAALDERIKIRNYRTVRTDQRVIEVEDAGANLVLSE